MEALKTLCRWIDAVNVWVGRGVAWLSLSLVAVVFGDVILRYVFDKSYVFAQELEWHIFAFIFLIGGGYTLFCDAHVRVDVIYQRLSPRAKAWVNLLGVIFFLIPGCLMVIITSWKFVHNSWAVMEGSPDPGGIPYRFLIKSALPVGFMLLTLEGVSMGLHSLMQLLGVEKEQGA